MDFRKKYKDDTSPIWKGAGLLLVVIGAIWGCFEMFVCYARSNFDRGKDIIGLKSVPLGLIVIGCVLYLIGKEKRQQLFEQQVLEQLDELNKTKINNSD